MAALSNLRVLDLSRLLPGPFASLVLADLGAQVDKVEDLETGDYLRAMPPHHGDESAMFLALNRNKRSLCLDLKKPEGRKTFATLVTRYDVLIDQFRPGVFDKLGLGYPVLLEQNPKLIICALTGYGQSGPYRNDAGHDLNYLARAGLLGLQGPAGGPPQVPAMQIADIGGALWSVIAILAAVREREQTGIGKVIDIAMLEATLGFASLAWAQLLQEGSALRGAETLSGGLAIYNVYETKDDRFVALGALEPKFWFKFAEAVGLEADMSAVMPGPHQEALKQKLRSLFRGRTRDEWTQFAKEVDCCLTAVVEPSEWGKDEHLAARRLLIDVPTHAGPHRQLRTPVTPDLMTHQPPPRRGEHTRFILMEAGLSAAEVDALYAHGVVR